jgi:hypothetical protein
VDDSGRLIVYAAWAIGCIVVWGRVFIVAWQDYGRLPDEERRNYAPPSSRLAAVRDRAFREVVSDFALLLVGVFAAASLFVLIFGQEIAGLRGFSLALALGAFLGAGLVRLR